MCVEPYIRIIRRHDVGIVSFLDGMDFQVLLLFTLSLHLPCENLVTEGVTSPISQIGIAFMYKMSATQATQ